MIINGKERKFMFTVNTAIEISQMCPDNNLERLEEILSGDDFTKTLPNIARFIVAMNHGYEMAAHFTNPEHEIDVITMDELLNCDFNVIMEVLDNAMSVYKNDSKREVKTEAAQTKGKKNKGNPIKLNRAWYLFYGYQLGMSKNEILTFRYGQFRDLMSCFAVYNGSAKIKNDKNFMELVNLR